MFKCYARSKSFTSVLLLHWNWNLNVYGIGNCNKQYAFCAWHDILICPIRQNKQPLNCIRGHAGFVLSNSWRSLPPSMLLSLFPPVDCLFTIDRGWCVLSGSPQFYDNLKWRKVTNGSWLGLSSLKWSPSPSQQSACPPSVLKSLHWT